jgi:hypothetical protein
MTAAAAFHLTLLPPDLVPDLQSVRKRLGAPMLSAMAHYVGGAAALSHRQCAAALQAIAAQMPVRKSERPVLQSDPPIEAGAASAPSVEESAAQSVAQSAAQSVANDAAHDRYFHVCRVPAPTAIVFVRTIMSAASLFHAEMASAYQPPDATRFAAVGAGMNALLGRIAGVRPAPVDDTAPEPSASPATVDPMKRWVLGHQIFATLTQGILFALQIFEAASRKADEQAAREALWLAADLLMASAAAFRFTADFPAAAYRDIVRPSMMAHHVGQGFSGLLSVDHRALVSALIRIRPMMADTRVRLPAEHERLTRALNHVYENHKFVCAQFDGAKKPSLFCPNSSPVPGVKQLQRYKRARVRLLRPGSDSDPLIL